MIVVTGAAGFIGSNLVRGLNRLGIDDIILVDDLLQGEKHLNLNTLRFADYLDKDSALDELPRIKEITTIFHQGACSSTTESDGRYMMANNYEYSKRLLHYALESDTDFIYASSAAVYGDGVDGYREERACESPLNVYGFSKYAFDNYVRRILSKDPTSNVVGLRYFNVYGPQEGHKGRMASVACHLYDQLKAGKPMQLFEGSDGFLRDFVYVEDVVAVNLHFFASRTSGIFNCGTGAARSFLDIANTLRRLHSGGNIEFVPFPADLKGKYQRFTEASLSRLREAGCQHRFLSLEAGLEKYYEILTATGGMYR